MANWATRSTASGVLRAWHFDDDAKLGGLWTSEAFAGAYGISTNSSGDYSTISRDTTEGCTTAGALKFTIPSLSAGNFGSFGIRLGDTAAAIQVGIVGELGGVGEVLTELFVQCRVKWSAALAATTFLRDVGGYQAGIKFFDTASGYPLGSGLTGTSSNTKCVVQTYFQTRHPHVYNYGNSRTSPGDVVTFAWMDDTSLGRNFDLQNQRASPFCRYPDFANCWTMPGDEWVTFKLRQKILGRSTDPAFMDHEGDLWVQGASGGSIKLVAWGPTRPGYSPRLWGSGEGMGQIYLFPYMTDKDPTQIHDAGAVWYDELIISRYDIEDADPPMVVGAPSRVAIPRVRVR